MSDGMPYKSSERIGRCVIFQTGVAWESGVLFITEVVLREV